MWIKDNWTTRARRWELACAWLNQLATWFNRLTFRGPLRENRTSGSWVISHLRPSADAADDGDCTVIGPRSGGVTSEGLEAADTDTASPGSTTIFKPVRIYAMTRVAYYHAGDQTLYGYVRALTFDAWGHLQGIGAEERITIDVTGACPEE